MEVVEEITRKAKDSLDLTHGIVYIGESYIELGYFLKNPNTLYIITKNGIVCSCLSPDNPYIVYDNRQGYYLINHPELGYEIEGNPSIKGSGHYPYITIAQDYEALTSIHKVTRNCKTTQQPDNLGTLINYTFGLEFETSRGFVPEHLCYANGLIPLRDGSISGVEYASIVLFGDKGMGLLAEEIKTLTKYTEYDKECSLHVHFGGYPVDPKYIFVLHEVCRKLEPYLMSIVPCLTFKTSLYKKSGRDYCNYLPDLKDFSSLYKNITGVAYIGKLTCSHPKDPERNRKWHVDTRYRWLNLVNMVCYKGPKTVEFRLLRPTYNIKKIKYWLLLFNAILTYSEHLGDSLRTEPKLNKDMIGEVSIDLILKHVYMGDILEKMRSITSSLQDIVREQFLNNDFIGAKTSIEDKILSHEPDL